MNNFIDFQNFVKVILLIYFKNSNYIKLEQTNVIIIAQKINVMKTKPDQLVQPE